MELKPHIFVAMSFAEDYLPRYQKVIAPAISSIDHNGSALTPTRVDISKTGDSLLTDIMDGIAHSQMILADVSSIGKDSKTGRPYRNGNVMYEVGLALACRQPSDVLLVRDDDDPFLFDVSTVPHMRIDFTDTDRAQDLLRTELRARLREQRFVDDARVKIAIASLSDQELKILVQMEPDEVRGWNHGGTVLSVYEAAIMRLLDKRLFEVVGKYREGHPAYRLTPLGRVVSSTVKSDLSLYNNIRDIDPSP